LDSKITTIFKKTEDTYALKLKASREFYSQVTNRFGSMAFHLRSLEDPSRARLGMGECLQHGLIVPYDVMMEKEGTICILL
jgi:hypothetical protein